MSTPFLGYGKTAYGLQTYGQVDIWDLQKSDAVILKGLRVNFYDKTEYLLYSFFSETKTFPFSKLRFSTIKSSQNGSGPNELEMEMNEDLIKYGVEVDTFDFVEIFLNDNALPLWCGYLVQIPSETDVNEIYKYKADGFVKALETVYINRANITSAKSINAIITDIVQNELLAAIKGVNYNPDKIQNTPYTVSSFTLAQTNAKEVFKKLCGIATDYEFGIDAEREFFFRKKITEINQNLIYASGFNCQKIEIDRGDFGTIKNKIIVNKKASSGSGVTYRGTFNAVASQNIYGIRAEQVNIPETISNTEADLYGQGQLALKAYPKYKGKINKIPVESFSLKECQGFGRLFTQDKWFIDLFLSCESLTNWTTSDGTNLVLSLETTTIHELSGAIKATATGSSALNDYIEYSLPETQDWETTKTISFWIYSSRSGEFLQIGFGVAAYSENLYSFYINEANAWQKIEINIDGDGIENVGKIGIKVINADVSFNFIVDDFRRFYYGRKKYELELMKIEWDFSQSEHTVNLDFGSIDYPYSAKIAEINSKIKALEQSAKT